MPRFLSYFLVFMPRFLSFARIYALLSVISGVMLRFLSLPRFLNLSIRLLQVLRCFSEWIRYGKNSCLVGKNLESIMAGCVFRQDAILVACFSLIHPLCYAYV